MAVCSITGTIQKADGSAISGQQIVATIQSSADDLGGQVATGIGIVSDPIEAFTDEDGNFEIEIIRGATILFEIPSINLRKVVVVPDLVEIDFVLLI